MFVRSFFIGMLLFCVGMIDVHAQETEVSNPRNVDLEKEPWLVESARLPKSHPAFTRPKTIWADSHPFEPISEVIGSNEIEVLRWVGKEPPKDLLGKYVLIEVWATWCPPCRRSLPLLNHFHEKFKDDLLVVSICETEEIAMKNMEGPIKMEDVKCYLAVDTARRFANKLGVWGIPHAVILEPESGAIIWEGMPTQPGHELNEKFIERIIQIGKKRKEEGKLPKEAPFKFVAKKPDPNVPNVRPMGPGGNRHAQEDEFGSPSFHPED